MTASGANGPVVVTGGGGFIGSHVVRLLQRTGLEVRTLLGPRAALLVDPPGSVVAVRGDVEEQDLLDDLVAGASVVVHLAGPASVAASFGSPGEYRRVHVDGTAAVCDAAARAGVGRLILVSSAEVYGRAGERPVSEAARPAPRSPYAACKVAAEAIVGAEVRAGRIGSAVVVRPFSVFGDGMADWSLVGGLIAAASRGEAVAVRDPGPVRDYVHVGDVAEALVRLQAAPIPEDVVTLNLSTGVGRSVGEVRDVIADVFGVPVEHHLRPPDRPREADIRFLVGDPTATRSLLGWAPATTLRAGVSAAVGLQGSQRPREVSR